MFKKEIVNAISSFHLYFLAIWNFGNWMLTLQSLLWTNSFLIGLGKSRTFSISRDCEILSKNLAWLLRDLRDLTFNLIIVPLPIKVEQITWKYTHLAIKSDMKLSCNVWVRKYLKFNKNLQKWSFYVDIFSKSWIIQ